MKRIVFFAQLLCISLICTMSNFVQSSQLGVASAVALPGLQSYSAELITPYAEQALQALADYQAISAQLLPSALSSISAAMKSPYVLMVAGGGTCLAYVMTGASPDPILSPERLMGITQEHMLDLATSAVGGLSYGVGVQAKEGMLGLTSYAKPILLAGTLGGLALVNTMMPSEDLPYLVPVLNNLMLGALPNLLTDLPALGKKIRASLPGGNVTPSIKDAASVIQHKASKKQWQKKVKKVYDLITSDYVVAFVSFGAVITLQHVQGGTLSESDQALAMATLASATQLIQKTVVTDYAIRASKNLCETVTTGLSKAAHFSKRVYETCKTSLTSWMYPTKKE